MHKRLLLAALALSVVAARPPQRCPEGWPRNDGWTKDRTDLVEISWDGGHHVTFTPAPHITITKVCVNGAKTRVRYGEPGIPVRFQLGPRTGPTPYDAAATFK